MNITFTQYINNPLGEKTSVVTNRDMFMKMYKEKLDKILLREGGKVEYKLFVSKKDYYIHFKIPSEVVDKFYYDVVIHFYTKDPVIENSASLEKYNVEFYSNDPAFVYTFAHAFIKHNMFFTDLESRMSKQAIKQTAKEKNPDNLIGYVKSLFFAYILTKQYNLFSKAAYKMYATQYNKKEIINAVMQADKKIELRQEAEKEQTKKKKTQELKNRNISNATLSAHRTPNIKFAKKANVVKSTRTVKKAKKI